MPKVGQGIKIEKRGIRIANQGIGIDNRGNGIKNRGIRLLACLALDMINLSVYILLLTTLEVSALFLSLGRHCLCQFFVAVSRS